MTVTKVFAGLSEKRRGVVRPSNWNTLLFGYRNVNYSAAASARKRSNEKLKESTGVEGFMSIT